jgi:hypothetical protein
MEGIPFAIRLRADRTVVDTPYEGALPTRMYARAVARGEKRVLKSERYLSPVTGHDGCARGYSAPRR